MRSCSPIADRETRPLVSVVVIFLDEERFLEEAVASVFAQTYGAWELLLVDDGSIDGSTAIAQAYAARAPDRVRYLEHPGHANRGMSAARNLGVAAARGRYVAFLDADDAWLPRKLEHQVAVLDAHPTAAMVYGPTRWWYSWAGLSRDYRRDYVHPLGAKPNVLIDPPQLLTRFLEQEGISPCMCSMLVRRDVVEQVGGFEERFRGLYEDQAFCAKLCAQAPVLVTDACLQLYRQHPDSACSVAERTGEARAARAAFLTWLSEYLAARGIRDPELWRALGGELRRSRWGPTSRALGFGASMIRRLRPWLSVRRARTRDQAPVGDSARTS